MYDNIIYLCCHSDENVKETNSSTQNGTGNHSNSSKEPPTSVPVYHVTFPGTFIEVLHHHHHH